MTIQLHANRIISSDATTVSAIAVGYGGWAVMQLRGRTLTLAQALAAVQLAEVLPRPRPASDDDPLCAQVIGWLNELGLGLAPLEVANALEIPCRFTPLPLSRDQHLPQRRRFPRWPAR